MKVFGFLYISLVAGDTTDPKPCHQKRSEDFSGMTFCQDDIWLYQTKVCTVDTSVCWCIDAVTGIHRDNEYCGLPTKISSDRYVYTTLNNMESVFYFLLQLTFILMLCYLL